MRPDQNNVREHPPFISLLLYIYYLRQVNEVNGGDNVFVRCVCLCLSVCLSAAAGHGS